MVHPTLLLLLLLSLGFTAPTPAQADGILYVKPTEDTKCPCEPCCTLDEYVNDNFTYNNTVMKFLPGNHTLSEVFQFHDLFNLTMEATHPTMNETIIFCSDDPPQALKFSDGSQISIQGLSIFNCGDPTLGFGTLHFYNCVNVSISGVTIEILGNSAGYSPIGISALKVHGISVSLVSIHLRDNGNATGILLQTISGNATFEEVEVTGLGGGSTAILSEMYSQPQYIIIIRHCSFHLPVLIDTWREGCTHQLVILVNTLFSNITGVSLGLLGISNVLLQNVTFANTYPRPFSFIENSEYFRSSLNVTGTALHMEGNVNVLLQNVTFVNNTYYGPTVLGASVVNIISVIEEDAVQKVTFIDCEFYNNLGTPISVDGSTLYFSGNIIFRNNTGYNGGAMRFTGGSYVNISDNANITFENNNAEYAGGAVFVDQNSRYCFFRESGRCNCSYLPFSLNFINNTALKGGNAIYGADISDCTYLGYGQPYSECTCYAFELLELNSPGLYFEPGLDSDPSQVSSDPIRVCLCENGTLNKGKIHCSINSLNETYYPGEEFSISAVNVGDMNGPVDGTVYAQFLPQYNESVLGELQLSQQVNHTKCTELKYSILSKPGLVIMALNVNSAPLLIHQKYNNILRININLLPCPLGFNLSEYPHQCICDKQLKRNNITCNITTHTIQRSGTVWVNASFNGNISNGTIVHKNCPFGYCKTEVVHVNLEHPDMQCAFHHSGTLCGACQPGLSLALGSPQCLSHCSNRNISLLIAFAGAGLALVFFIKIFDLTVAVGTINGLIFYANIVQAAQDTFLPAGDASPLRVLIAWLNLDLGIQTCFFDGLDGYWKTWLQFVFPFYIWAIILLIIYLSRCSQTVARIFGNNSVPVLATLILLSYTKLFRTIVSALTFNYLEFPDGSKTVVWSFDGNIQYLSPKHIPLFLFALGVFLFLWLPFTVLLLFEQCLQRIEMYTVRKWMLRLKPFFDAYFGPLRGNHRYWVGVLLVARAILLLVFGPFKPANDPSVNLLAVNTVVLLLMMYISNLPHGHTDMDGGNRFRFWIGSCYKKWYLSLLETSFLVNLAILSAVTLAVGNQAAVVYTSVGIAFCQFIGIVVYHVYIIIRQSWKVRKQGEVGGAQVNREDYEPINEPNRREMWPPEAPYRRMDQCREPLLEEN